MPLSTSRSLWVALLVGVQLLGGAVRAGDRPVARPRQVTCRACIVVDDTGTTLWERRAERRRANASTTKMVTAIVASAGSDLGKTVSVSAKAASTGGGGLDLQAGERYTVEELLYALLLTSSNDAAVALAEHAAGSEAAFVAEMNVFRRALELTDTRFVTPHGLDVRGHYSSASDLARLAVAVLRRPRLAAIVATESIAIRRDGAGGDKGKELLENRNPLLESYRGAIGVKTGFTDRAGNVLVAAARRQGRRVIAVAMGSADAAADARALLDYGFARLRRGLLLGAQASVGGLVFDPAGAVPAAAGATVRGIQDPSEVVVTFAPRPTVGLPLQPGDVVGEAIVSGPRGKIETVAAVAGVRVDASEPSWVARLLAALLRVTYLAGRVAGAV